MHCLVRACVAACLVFASIAQCAAADFTLAQVLDYPYPSGLVAAENGEHIAWVVNLRGARNVWVADGTGSPVAAKTTSTTTTARKSPN